MDGQSYGIQWIEHHAPGDMKTARQLIIDDHPPENEDELITGGPHQQDYLVHEVSAEEDIDQIAAENLIFMAHDGQMVAEIITATTDANGAVVVSASDGTPLDCASVMQQADAMNVMDGDDGQADGGATIVQFSEDYAETQMVTEEVITDDWVQHQGEERVEIPAEQIIGSNAHVPLDNEVPLPTVQDEYTALRPYPCDFCSRRFRKKASLMNHMVAHQNDRPHLCKLCGSRFFRRSDLINHLKAHAETPDPEFDDVDFMHFVEQTAMDQQQQQRATDHYYDQDWNIQPTPTTSATSKSTRKMNSHSISGNSSSSSTAARGRISRIKPKEEHNFTIDESVGQHNRTSHSSQMEYDGQELQASTAAVKLMQDNPPSSTQENFPVIDDSKPFVCQQCGLAFAREKALLSHTKNHRNDSPYECHQCNEIFWDSPSLQDHLKTHQFEDSNSEYDPGEAEETQSESESEYLYGEFYCHQCGMSFHRQDLLKRHAKSHVKSEVDLKDRHCCNTCGETFAEALDLLAHAEIHARYPPFKCVLCGESFFEESTIKRHLTNLHANEMTTNSCILCGKECRDRKALMKHAWDHSREKCHSCSKCGKNFHNKARLKRHMASHRDKSVTCDVCHEEFPDGRTLSNHRHSHSATSSGKLFPCHECGKTFGSRSSQQIHVRIHTGERPYGCRFCWKAFADGGTLRKHERIHTGEKPYACSVCPRAFNQRVVLREHIRSHHSGLDAKRGTYFCSVCSAELPSSGELIQHLIQHSDMNTAMQRQPITGPRKYKRRRKLKPHEIERLRIEQKSNGGVVGSDIDISDFDMDNVDDLLGIPETSTATSNSKRRNKQNSITELVTTAGGSSQSETTHKKERYNSTGSNSDGKMNWQSKLMNSNDDSYKSLLSNLETTLQSIDTLVVGNNGNATQYNDSTMSTETAQRTEQVSIVKTEPTAIHAASSSARARPNKRSAGKVSKSTRPRMIHTERTRVSGNSENAGNSKRRSKTLITRSEPAKMDLLSNRSSNIVDDYEIISPDMHPPNQISSSPLHSIKQENNNNNNNHDHMTTSSSLSSQRSDLYDAQLLLEATALRKEVYEKYNPNIVNDLEEILRSPDKSDKGRQRFTSESSTAQYLADHSEEDQNLIKIEPTSPDIHEIVSGSSDRRSSLRSTRRRAASNRKYLEFETEIANISIGNNMNVKSPRNKTAKSPKKESKTYLSYSVGGYENVVTTSVPSSSSTAVSSSSFSSISAVVTAAANAAAAVATASSSTERKQRYFECEMCSAVFPDRAQLLDHVPIHI